MNVLVSLFNSLPGAAGQGLIWGIMAIGVYITYKILDVADLTVDGSLATGGAVAALCVSMGWNPWLAVLAAVLAGMLAGLATGVLHTACGIPAEDLATVLRRFLHPDGKVFIREMDGALFRFHGQGPVSGISY